MSLTARLGILPYLFNDMGTHMKTTIDIADQLLTEAKQWAVSEGTTVRALVEAGLRKVLSERQRPTKAFQLRKSTFKGAGLQPELQGAGWERLRDMAYDGHGA